MDYNAEKIYREFSHQRADPKGVIPKFRDGMRRRLYSPRGGAYNPRMLDLWRLFYDLFFAPVVHLAAPFIALCNADVRSGLAARRGWRAGLAETVIPIVSSSAAASRLWATPLSLVFIDGGHTFEAAFNDYSSWVSHLIPGGYLAIHDLFPDPAKGGQAPWCVYNLALASGLFEALPTIGTLGLLRRAPCGTVTSAAAAAWEKLRP